MIKLDAGKINIVIDGQFGSTGKGLIAGYIGETCHIDMAVSNAGPNSGHTYITRSGDKIITKQLPIASLVGNKPTAYLCAGAVIDPDIVVEEIDKYEPTEVLVDPRAAIISPECVAAEKHEASAATKIASTQKGVGEGLIQKIRREYAVGNSPHAESIASYVDSVNLSHYCGQGATVLMEVPQGVHLGINSGFWPHTTSREVSVSQALSDACVHPKHLGKVIMVIRTFPIRVGNIFGPDGVELGFSGQFFPDSEETTWAALGQPEELTTVTKRVRRVATFSWQQLRDAVRLCQPDYLMLNFLNYLSEPEQFNFIRKVRTVCPNIQLLGGYGPTFHDVKAL